MKKFVSLAAAFAVLLCFGMTASARPQYNAIFKATYVDKSDNEAFKKVVTEEAKCNVCHKGTKKTDRNDYGQALNKILNKERFDELKADKEALEKAVAEALKKVETDKSPSGKTFGELIKAGELPGGKP